MRMRTKVLIVTLVGAGALLLIVLALILTLRAQTAYASIRPPHRNAHGPYVEVSLVDTTVAPGEYLSFGALFHGLLCSSRADQSKCNYKDRFVSGITYKYELLNSSDTTPTNCSVSGLDH